MSGTKPKPPSVQPVPKKHIEILEFEGRRYWRPLSKSAKEAKSSALAKWSAMSRHSQSGRIPNVFGSRFASGRIEKLFQQFLWREEQTGTLSSHVGFSQGLFTSFSAFPRGLFVQNIVKYKSSRWRVHFFEIFSPLLGEMMQFDDHIFRMGWKRPTRSLQQYLTPWIRPPTPRALFKEGWRAARPALSTWRFCTTGTDGLDDFHRMRDAFQGWKDAMPKDWTGGKLDGWMKMAKKDEVHVK